MTEHFEPIYRPLTEAQRADAARQPLMTMAEALAIDERVRIEQAKEAALPLLPVQWIEEG